ncbi:MAG: hypothetical protein AB1497_10565 [Bacillota bacterium]
MCGWVDAKNRNGDVFKCQKTLTRFRA